ncbi:MAG: AbrB/MazE/SpoVT family DNA-binding domain-containing protein [Rhodothermaceae bacterium]|nr:AbrB/MazE/SpoVT family DNA-binding domain-containing protein [Rhodothermaceae bacterium]MXZ17868.1 AbrB/MazE/SpoVT family DNA-binding domain-containing protein [Rhodothermaceae bacterium]MXZ56864.1 AbrB/MazE/SpoVT family DNA-binding domain-containing protein [Rhodothermaceae bacterium]MYB91411.1 AbrB/MazE/SpoVT family DNA-binding domain-containing protein [Rhodothermaceae bacterium]MYD67887.1 AbrB/MazE/SpoVT family DNA-binding domain-containing protein [Rhodothermaceae bacterium]
MITTTVSSDGQVILPTEILIALGLRPGDRVNFIRMENGNYAILPRIHSVKNLNGVLRRAAQKSVSLEEMDQAIAKGAAGNDRS